MKYTIPDYFHQVYTNVVLSNDHLHALKLALRELPRPSRDQLANIAIYTNPLPPLIQEMWFPGLDTEELPFCVRVQYTAYNPGHDEVFEGREFVFKDDRGRRHYRTVTISNEEDLIGYIQGLYGCDGENP